MSYPKALYLGTKKKRKLKTAKNADDEQKLRSLGYVSYPELPDDVAPPKPNQSQNDCDDLRQKWGDVSAIKARLNELEPSDDEVASGGVADEMARFRTMTVKQLQDELRSRGISYKSGDNKSELLQLLQQHLNSTSPMPIPREEDVLDL